jgi:hypothetical protein
LVGNIGNFAGREYQELKKRVLAAHGRSRWEKVDSLLAFPKMGTNERPSVVLSRLNRLKPATLEELYMAIFLTVNLVRLIRHSAVLVATRSRHKR